MITPLSGGGSHATTDPVWWRHYDALKSDEVRWYDTLTNIQWSKQDIEKKPQELSIPNLATPEGVYRSAFRLHYKNLVCHVHNIYLYDY